MIKYEEEIAQAKTIIVHVNSRTSGFFLIVSGNMFVLNLRMILFAKSEFVIFLGTNEIRLGLNVKNRKRRIERIYVKKPIMQSEKRNAHRPKIARPTNRKIDSLMRLTPKCFLMRMQRVIYQTK